MKDTNEDHIFRVANWALVAYAALLIVVANNVGVLSKIGGQNHSALTGAMGALGAGPGALFKLYHTCATAYKAKTRAEVYRFNEQLKSLSNFGSNAAVAVIAAIGLSQVLTQKLGAIYLAYAICGGMWLHTESRNLLLALKSEPDDLELIKPPERLIPRSDAEAPPAEPVSELQS